MIGEEAPLSEVVRLFARAMYRATAFRPVDPNWNNRGRNVQQYELRVKRLDVTFDERLKALYEGAMAKGLWKGTGAMHDRESYWVEGVLAYFDATPETATPNDFARVVGTRELLRAYDAGLYELVNETMAYDGHVDWRLRE